MRSVLMAASPVESSRDWLDYVSAWSGLAGALLAGAAIAYAAWQAAQSKKDLVRERRLEFELGLLAELRTQMSITQFQHVSGYVGALVRSSDDETDLPVLRAVVGVKSGPRGNQLKRDSSAAAKERGVDPHGELLKVAVGEIDAAIERRLRK
jgi:hypothetical protein